MTYNKNVMLSQHADHINKRHLDFNKEPRFSKFLQFLNLTATLAFLGWKTFIMDSEDYKILDGYKVGHVIITCLQDEESD